MKISKTYTFNIHDRIINLTEDDAVELYNVLKSALSAVVTDTNNSDSGVQNSESSVQTPAEN